MTDAHAISKFYDRFSNRLVQDYIHGNLRIESAIAFVRSQIPGDARRLWDVGCGIGWSSRALRRSRGDLAVTGLDIGSENIRIADALFAGPNVDFRVDDLSAYDGPAVADVVTMIDVYEHIPPAARAGFHGTLDRVLKRRGVVLMTTPSPRHQRWLAAHRPEGLQIVDETIDDAQVNRLAADLSATVVQSVDIDLMEPGQYRYTILTRDPTRRFAPIVKRPWPIRYPNIRRARSLTRRLGVNPTSILRRRHVERRLGIAVGDDRRNDDLRGGGVRRAA